MPPETPPSGLPALSPSDGEKAGGPEATASENRASGPDAIAAGLDMDRPALGTVLAAAKQRLAQAGIPDAGFEARRLIEHFAEVSATDLVARPERLIAPEVLVRIGSALARRAAGEPLHRILEWREFYGLRLALSPETLEPRPDTETLVEAALPFVRATVQAKGGCCILDLGTGTGAIALALLHEVPGAEAVGVDVSAAALATADANAARLGLSERFRTLHSDWFGRVAGRFHLIVTNPPYISHEELEALPPEVARFDPPKALDGGADGLDAYRRIAGASDRFLQPRGRVAVEIGYRQREAVTAIFRRAGFALVAAHRDYGGNDRTLVFEARGNGGGERERTGRPLVIGGE